VKRILFVCYNITLVNYLKRLLSEKKVPIGSEGVEVCSFYELCAKIIGEPVSHENEEREYYDLVQESALERVEAFPRKYDAVLIDEGQDFSDGMYKVVVSLLNPDTSNLTIALDNLQNIYTRKQTWKRLGIDAAGKVRRLKDVYRNTVEIFEFATAFIRGTPSAAAEKAFEGQTELFPGFMDNHGPGPRIDRFDDPWDVLDHIAHTIRNLSETEKVPLSQIAVIYASKRFSSSSNATLPEAVIARLESFGVLSTWASMDYRAKKAYDITTERVTVSTVHSAKGADWSCVFLIGFDLIDNSYWTDDQIDRLVYIAATRARDQLWIPYTRETALISRMLECMKQ
jgi:superfamily I DNA/RNA helicase